MKRPNRKDYIQKASIIQLLADLEMYIDYLEAQNQALTIPVVSNCTTCNDEINYKGVCEMCYTELKLNDLD